MAQRIVLIGYGAIGQAVRRLLPSTVEVVAVLVRDRAHAAAQAPDMADLLVTSLAEALARRPDLVVECAGHQAVDAFGAEVLGAGIDLLLSSVGSLADATREQRLLDAARRAGRQLMLPAGAIGGIDWLAAARGAGLQRVLYRSRKPPAAWAGSAAEAACDLGALTGAFTFFHGTAREAALKFPRNANVAATVALAGLGFEATEVQMLADPAAEGNVHEIEASSSGGSIALRIVGQPDPRNPRTSVMTAHSLVRSILSRGASLVI
ncbi:hypothetical protein RD110_02340 [Rhodoferax koreense]|uniref:L-aspartate dehydrogenase n=1 Tax=Rhodoferax koreensis TaxID=1842727 RepID=A0A1P8JR43_9BURK|nr:aspartate dehydrogenase [Rhodoferax koreense]APW36195.1 hypothetical protein RD110_02340 [Rhodoferax koreense]